MLRRSKDLKAPSVFKVHPSDKALLKKEQLQPVASLQEKKFQLSFKEERALEREHREKAEQDVEEYEETDSRASARLWRCLQGLGVPWCVVISSYFIFIFAKRPRPRRRNLVQVSVSPSAVSIAVTCLVDVYGLQEEMDIRPDIEDIE